MKLVNEEGNTFDWKNSLTFTYKITLFNTIHVIAITVHGEQEAVSNFHILNKRGLKYSIYHV